MELMLSKLQKRQIIFGLTRELIRNSPGYSHARKEIAARKNQAEPPIIFQPQKIENKNVEILKSVRAEERKNIPVYKPEMMRPRLIIPQRKIIANAFNNPEPGRFEPSLKPIPAPRESFRPVLGDARLVVPETKLPVQFQYLQPTPTNQDVDLSRLNPLIKDPQVKIIECPGPEQNVMVTGTMGTQKTGIILNKDEISDIINRFSKISKIPVHDGVFKVVFGRFIFMAIVSEIVGSRFTLRKMITGR